MFYVTVDDYVVGIGPATAGVDRAGARLYDELHEPNGFAFLVTVESALEHRPGVVVSVRCDPGPDQAFHPGVVLVPETRLLLIGAGTTLAAYDLAEPRRVWLDTTDLGFWGWKRHGAFLLMSAELELAAWDLHGKKLWSTFVEPPWSYAVHDGIVTLEVMGHESRFEVASGPVRTQKL